MSRRRRHDEDFSTGAKIGCLSAIVLLIVLIFVVRSCNLRNKEENDRAARAAQARLRELAPDATRPEFLTRLLAEFDLLTVRGRNAEWQRVGQTLQLTINSDHGNIDNDLGMVARGDVADRLAVIFWLLAPKPGSIQFVDVAWEIEDSEGRRAEYEVRLRPADYLTNAELRERDRVEDELEDLATDLTAWLKSGHAVDTRRDTASGRTFTLRRK